MNFNKRRKNSKKAIDQNGKVKDEYSLTLNGVRMGLLSEKGNYMSKKTKNGMTRLRKINKTEDNRNNYIDFYKKTMGGDPSKKKEVKVKVDNLVLGAAKSKVKVMPVKMGHKKKMYMGDQGGDQQAERLPTLKVKRLNTKNIDQRVSKQTQDETTSDKKPDVGFPHQNLINQVKSVRGIDFSKMYDETKRQEDIKISEAITKINELVEANEILKNVRVISSKNNLRAVREYYVLKTIVKIHNRNQNLSKSQKQQSTPQQKKPENMRAGLVIDLQSMFGVPNVNTANLKKLLEMNGVFNNEDIIQRPLPASQLPDEDPSTDMDPEDAKQYSTVGAADEGQFFGQVKKNPKRFDVNKYYEEGKAVRQFSNKNGRQSMFKNSFKLRIKKKNEPKKKRLNIF